MTKNSNILTVFIEKSFRRDNRYNQNEKLSTQHPKLSTQPHLNFKSRANTQPIAKIPQNIRESLKRHPDNPSAPLNPSFEAAPFREQTVHQPGGVDVSNGGHHPREISGELSRRLKAKTR